MGIDYHLYNFLRWQAAIAPLDHVLTIGRLSLDLPLDYVKADFPGFNAQGPYAESLLSVLGARSVSSVDASMYENPTFTGDLNKSLCHSKRYSTIVDGGSIEHVFDIAQAFRNIVELCEVGGRIIHALPVNNLNGHGFWQFCSDLMYSVYCKEAGFSDTKVFYASAINKEYWYLAPYPKSGSRVEIVSIEPIILLCITTKVREVEFIKPVQPYYLGVWQGSPLLQRTSFFSLLKKFLKNKRRLLNPFRNALTIGGLATGFSHYSIRSSGFKRVSVVKLFDSGNQ